MGTAPLSEELAAEAVRRVEDQLRAGRVPRGRGGGKSAVQAAAEQAISDGWLKTMGAFESRLRSAWSVYGLAPDWTLYEHPEAEAREMPERAVQRSLDEDVELQRAKSTATVASRQLRDALSKIATLEDELQDYKIAFQSAARPAEWTVRAPLGGKSEHIPELLTSDFQIGEVIRASETDYSFGYDTETFRRRYRRLISTTIDLCFRHAGDGWSYPGIVYARGGDTISGAIHDELAETDDLTPIEAVEVAFEEEAAGIAKLLEAFGRVEVKDCGGGNHDRDTHKPRTKRTTGHSYDRLVSYMLRREFMRDDRVTFQGTLSPDVYFSIYDTRILLTHGDKIGSRGGHGMIGPAATISRGFQKVILEQQALGRPVDMVQCGHFHTPLWLELGICNGCLPGYSEFAKSLRMRPQPPSQFLMFFAAKRGLVDLRKVFVEDGISGQRAAAAAFAGAAA